MLLYGPRWIYSLPLVFLVPAALVLQRRLLWPLGIFFIIFFLLIMEFNIPFHYFQFSKDSKTLRIMTYNINRWDVTNEEFADLISKVNPDIIAIQECASPRRFKGPSGWNKIYAGESLVFSRFPIKRMEKLSTRKIGISGLLCEIETPSGPVNFCCVDLLTPRRALTRILNDKTVFDLSQTGYAQRRIFERRLESKGLAMLLRFTSGPMIMAGDFNLTVDSTIYREYWSGYLDAFTRTGFGFGYTKRTKINIFRYKSRIDHIPSTRHFRPVRCRIGPDYGSDHFPLVADLAFNNSGLSN